MRRLDGQVAVVLLADGQVSVVHPDPSVSTGWTRTPINGVSSVSRLSVAPAADGGLTMQAVVAGELLTLNLDPSYLPGTSTARGAIADRVVLGAAYGAGAVHSYAFSDSGPTPHPGFPNEEGYIWNVSVDGGPFRDSGYHEYLPVGTAPATSAALTSIAAVTTSDYLVEALQCRTQGHQDPGDDAGRGPDVGGDQAGDVDHSAVDLDQ
ncbi:MAG: hypothetical protein ABJA89_14255 [Lapillicoccus sp.]